MVPWRRICVLLAEASSDDACCARRQEYSPMCKCSSFWLIVVYWFVLRICFAPRLAQPEQCFFFDVLGLLCSRECNEGFVSRQVPVYSIDYRRPPEHAFPTQIEDCLCAFLRIRQELGNEVSGAKQKRATGGDLGEIIKGSATLDFEGKG